MTDQHPELAAEQAYIDRAYECLEASKADALKIRELTVTGPGGTHQARVERNAFDEKIVSRLEQLEIGDAALVFGRIDRIDDTDHSWDTNVLRLVDAVHRWSGNTCECLEYSSSEFASLVKTGDPLIASLRRDGIVIAGGSPHELTTAEG